MSTIANTSVTADKSATSNTGATTAIPSVQQIEAMYYSSIGKQFYWIAGLSMVNIILMLVGIGIYFPAGLSINYIVEELAYAFLGVGSPLYYVIAFIFGLISSGTFVLIGWLVVKGKAPMIWVGIALYIADLLVSIIGAILFQYPAMLLDTLFHGYMLFIVLRMFFGMKKAAKNIQNVTDKK